MSDMRLFSKTVAVVTALVLVIVSCRIQAVAEEAPRSWAIVTLTGTATINDAPAISGQTLFAKNTIATTISSSLTLDLPRARLEVSEQTELSVEVLADLLRAELKTGRLGLSTLRGTTTRVEILPGLSVVSDPAKPAKFTVAAGRDANFELRVSEGVVDVVDSRESGKGEQVTHVESNMTFSNAGLRQTSNDQSNLDSRERAAIFIAAGGALALLLVMIVSGDDPVADGPGGCVIVPSGESPQNPC